MHVFDICPTPEPSPLINLFLRGRQAAKQLTVAGKPTVDASITCRPIDTLAQYSADGSLLGCIETDGVVRVLRADGGAQVFSTQRPTVQALSLSPRGTFLLTWERISVGMDAGAVNGNLRIWRVATGECICSWLQKVLGEKSLWPAIAWSVDEQVAHRLVKDEVHFFDGHAPTQAPTHRLRIADVAQCSLEPTVGPHHVATFVPENKGAPAVLRIWNHPDFGEGRFVTSKSFFKASEAQLHWSPVGGALLIHTHTEFDKSNASYYGNTALYCMAKLEGGKVERCLLRKDGAIHCVSWAPAGDEFICIFGESPPEACIFNLKCEVTFSFGEAPRNTVSWSPHGRFLALAGFGNMAGELSFWDRRAAPKPRCLATVEAHMTVAFGWSADSRNFLTAILFPRLRVDNGFRIWSCSGGLVHEEKMEELSLALWRPQRTSAYAPLTDDDIRTDPAATAPKPTAQAKKYVPPGQRAAMSGGGSRSLADLDMAAGGAASAARGKSLASLVSAVEKSGSAAFRNGPPLGSEGAEGGSSKNGAKQKARRDAAAKKKAAKAAGGASMSALAAALKPAAATAEGELTEEKLQKKLRATEKKLRQVAELKELKAGGKLLEKTQLSKIENEADTVKDLDEINRILSELSTKDVADKWR